MYKGKPVIVGNRPIWRHPIFPWGWYSVSKDDFDLKDGEKIETDGAYKPNDGWGSTFVFEECQMKPRPSSTVIDPTIFRFDKKNNRWVSDDGEDIINMKGEQDA